MAWATAALMGSACETATTVSPGWRRRAGGRPRRRCGPASRRTTRRRGTGSRWGSAAPCATRAACSSFFSSAPVHVAEVDSSRPCARCGPAARGPWRSARRSPGCARAARRRPPRPSLAVERAIRSATGAPGPGRSARWSPGARPGRTLPVVGVWPWRTSSTSVGGGGRQADGPWPGQPIVARRGSGPSRGPGRVQDEVVDCRACPRLVAWREQVAREKRAAFRDEDLLGPPGARLRRSRRPRGDRRPGAGRPRRQPHGPDVHRRPLG